MLELYASYGKIIDKISRGRMQDCSGNLRGYHFKCIFCFHNICGIMKRSRKQDLFMHCYTDNLHYNPVLYAKE